MNIENNQNLNSQTPLNNTLKKSKHPNIANKQLFEQLKTLKNTLKCP
jgi:hypothetical protein